VSEHRVRDPPLTHARRADAVLAIVTLEPTPLDGEADFVIRARAGQVMSAVLEAMAKEDDRPCPSTTCC
jgi:NAD-dependent SIR2 family protein deacetylase